MNKLKLCSFLFILSLSVKAQSDNSNCNKPLTHITDSPFPIYHPNIDVPDIESNKLQYYFAEPVSSVCPNDTSVSGTCSRATIRYAYGRTFSNQPYDSITNPIRSDYDGNSTFDVYYSNIPSYSKNGKPLAVILHGGGGNKSQTAEVSKAIEYARRGYVAIVPDYTAGNDDIFGGSAAEYCHEEEFMFALQYAIMDVRAAIRKALYISSIDNSKPAIAKIDPTKIFLHGSSFGSITSLHLALMGDKDFFDYYASNTVEINGTSMIFSESLDNVEICESGSECGSFIPPEWIGQDLRSNIQGISFNGGFLAREDLLTSNHEIPLILTHGTCDVSTPYHRATAAQSLYRKNFARSGGSSTMDLPCQTEGNLDSIYLYGSEYIYNALKDSMKNFQNVGFLSFCGLNHAVNGKYGLINSSLAADIKLRPAIYETFRFFAQTLNNQIIPSFRFDLDHSLRYTLDENTCNAQPTPTENDNLKGEYYHGLDTLCSRCNSGTQPNSNLRIPFFQKEFNDSSNTDENRYVPINDFFLSDPDYEHCACPSKKS